MKKKFMALLMLLLGSYVASHSFEGNVDFNFSPNKTKTRINLNNNNLKINYTGVVEDKLQTLASIGPNLTINFGKNLDISLIGRYDHKPTEDIWNGAIGLSSNGLYVEPWVAINEVGDMKEFDAFGLYNGRINNLNVAASSLLISSPDDKSLWTAYAAIDNGINGIGVSKSTNNDLGGTLVHDGKLSEFAFFQYNPDNNSWNGKIIFAQNGVGALSSKGAMKQGGAIVGWSEQSHPYFTALGNKSADGLAFEFKFSGSDKDLETVLAGIGYNFGNLRASMSNAYNNNDTSTIATAITYDFNDGLVEIKIDDTGVMGAYLNIKF